nr:hypothetical protein [Tanacetum cinerariifolium]
METSKPLLKDEDGQEVDVHIYRSMIRSLMYLTSLRPDIIFDACARHQCKKQTVAANSITEAEYVAASSYCRQVNDQEQIQALVDKTKVIITENSIRSDLHFDDAEGTACLLIEEIFEGLTRMGTMASTIICLADNQKFNFSNLQEHVLDLQEAKASQAKEIVALKKKGRTNDDEMFRVDDLAREEVVMENTTSVKDSVALTTDVTEDEVTIAQALDTLKSTKPKVMIQEQEMSTIIPAATTIVKTVVPTPRAKGKAKMIEPEVPIKRKEQMRINEEYRDDKGNDFIVMDLEAQQSSTKRTAEHLESNISNKQKVDENFEPVIDDSEELRKCIEIVPDDGDEVLIEATPISSRSPTIIDYKIHKEGKKTYFKIIRADGNSQVY